MKYIWIHPRTKKLYARIQLKQSDGKYKTYLKAASSEMEAERLAEQMIKDLEREKQNTELTELFISVKNGQMDFKKFKAKIQSLYEKKFLKDSKN